MPRVETLTPPCAYVWAYAPSRCDAPAAIRSADHPCDGENKYRPKAGQNDRKGRALLGVRLRQDVSRADVEQKAGEKPQVKRQHLRRHLEKEGRGRAGDR